MNDLSDTKCNLRVVEAERFFMSGHRSVQVVDPINLGSNKRGFTPLDSPVSSFKIDVALPMHSLNQFKMKERIIKSCDFRLGKFRKSCQA